LKLLLHGPLPVMPACFRSVLLPHGSSVHAAVWIIEFFLSMPFFFHFVVSDLK
jgi:hypothetical protein